MVTSLLQPQQPFGIYLIQSLLGRGGMAEVYLAHQRDLKRDVAIKILLPHLLNSPELKRRFEQEAEVLARLENPHIIPVFNSGFVGEYAYIAMRYVNGGSLEDALTQGPLKHKRAGSMLTKLAPALDYIHENRVIHRDIKPLNILLDKTDNPYLSDFGIANIFAEEFGPRAEARQPKPRVMGTLAYMAPEQLRGEEVTPQTDLFAFGVTAYQMLMGNLPYDGTSKAAYLENYQQERWLNYTEMEKQLSPALIIVLDQMLSCEPQKRYANATSFAEAVVEALADLRIPVQVKPPPTTEKTTTNPIAKPKGHQTTVMEGGVPVPPGKAELRNTVAEVLQAANRANLDTPVESFTPTRDTPVETTATIPIPPVDSPVKKTTPPPLEPDRRTIIDPEEVKQTPPEAQPSIFQRPPLPAPEAPAAPEVKKKAPPVPHSTQAPAREKTGVPLRRSVVFNPGARPILPAICPVCSKPASRIIHINIGHGREQQPVTFCEEHARAYSRVGWRYVVLHVGSILLCLVVVMWHLWVGIIVSLMMLFLVLRNRATWLDSGARQARTVVRLSRENGRLRWDNLRADYADQLVAINPGNIEGSAIFREK